MAVAKVTLNNNVIVNMTDATATAAEILNDETAYIADGSKATGTASQDNALIITLSWDDDYFGDEGAWVPDATYAEILAAAQAGKTIATVVADWEASEATVDGIYNSIQSLYVYCVQQFDTGHNTVYVLDSNGLEIDDEWDVVAPSGTINITQSGNTDVTQYVTANVSPMTLPAYSSPTSTGTRRAVISSDYANTRYLNVPQGYNDSAQYYEILPHPLAVKTITENGTYSASSENYYGYESVSVNVRSSGTTPWSVAFGGRYTMTWYFIMFGLEVDIDSTDVGAYIIFRNATLSQPTDGAITAIVHDANGTKTFAYYNGEAVEVGTQAYEISSDTNFLAFEATSGTPTYGFDGGDYSLIVVYGGSGFFRFQTDTYQPGSGVTSAQFSLDENPPLYFCGLQTSVAANQYHRVQTVVKSDDIDVLCGTNFYTDTLGYYNDFTETYSNGVLTIASSGTNGGGYFHNPGTYTLYYAYADDFSGGNYQSKTVTPTEQTQQVTADTGYDALKKVTVNPIPSQYIVPSGNLAITSNSGQQTIDIAQYATATVNVPTGGGSVQTDTKTATASNYPTSLSFTGMKGEPKMFCVRLNAQVSSSGSTTYYYIVDITSHGTTTHGNCFRIGSTRRVENITSGYSWSYSGTTLTIRSSASSRSASPGAFYSGSYELMYVY